MIAPSATRIMRPISFHTTAARYFVALFALQIKLLLLNRYFHGRLRPCKGMRTHRLLGNCLIQPADRRVIEQVVAALLGEGPQRHLAASA